jgi:hypothetical protein
MVGLGWKSDGTANRYVWILVRKHLGIRSIRRSKGGLVLGYKALGMEICWNDLTARLKLGAEN